MPVETPAQPADATPADAAAAPAAPAIPPTAPASPDGQPATPSTPAAPEGQATETDGPAAPEPSATNPRADIEAFAASVGVNPAALSRFDSLPAAQAAVQFMVESTARTGLSSPPAATPATSAPVQAQQPAAQQSQAAQPIDLSALGLDSNDPAAKVIQQLESRLNQQDQLTTQLQQQFEQQQAAASQATQQQLMAEASTIVDSFTSPKYGTAESRTASQQIAVERLYDLADAIAIGHYQQGRPLPSLEARLAQARLIDEGTNAPVASETPALPVSQPAPSPAGAAMGLTERWSQNPEFRRQLGI